jgi:hypothetical protein
MDLSERFLKFEKEHNLFSREYAGERYWHMMRFSIMLRISTLLNQDMESIAKHYTSRRPLAEKGRLFIRFFALAVRSLFRSKPKAAEILVNDENNYKNIDGILTEIFVDPLMNYIDAQPVYLDANFMKRFGRKYPDCSRGKLRYYFMQMLSKLFGIYTDKREDEFLSTLGEAIRREFGVNIPSLTKHARKTSLFVKAFSHYANHLLDIVKPKALVFVCHYSAELFVLTREAKRRRIPVIELQHGVLSDIAYRFEDTTESAVYFPDYVLTYGEYWSEQTKLPCGVRAIAVGFPHLDARIEKLSHIVREERLIVFYSNLNNELIKVLAEFAGPATSRGYRIVCKLHPSECDKWRSYYPELENIDVEIIDTPFDVYVLLLSARHHVGGNSAVMFEAIRTGGYVHTHISGRNYLGDMTKLGASIEFSNAEELLEHILEADRSGALPDNPRAAQMLFSGNALEKQVAAIREIISCSRAKS